MCAMGNHNMMLRSQNEAQKNDQTKHLSLDKETINM